VLDTRRENDWRNGRPAARTLPWTDKPHNGCLEGRDRRFEFGTPTPTGAAAIAGYIWLFVHLPVRSSELLDRLSILIGATEV
jgi:hypothetical protein